MTKRKPYEAECGVCGSRETAHCQMDEPGVDHWGGCGLSHHEFKPVKKQDKEPRP